MLRKQTDKIKVTARVNVKFPVHVFERTIFTLYKTLNRLRTCNIQSIKDRGPDHLLSLMDS